MADLWVYGDTTTKVTDGNMQEYVSKYLTQHIVTGKHLQLIMLLTKKVSDALLPCPMHSDCNIRAEAVNVKLINSL